MKKEREVRKGKSGEIIHVWVVSDLLPAFRSMSLYVPPDQSLLRFGDTLEEGGVALHPIEDPLLHPSTNKT